MSTSPSPITPRPCESIQDPELRAQVTSAVDAKVVELERNTLIKRVADVGDAIDELAIALPIAALLLFGAAIAVAADRRRALGRVGWGVALSGPALFFVEIALDATIRGRGWVNPDAVDQALGAFLGGMTWVALWLAVGGAAIVAASSGRLRTDTADRLVGRAWSFLRTAPDGRLGRAVRALVLLALGAAITTIAASRMISSQRLRPTNRRSNISGTTNVGAGELSREPAADRGRFRSRAR